MSGVTIIFVGADVENALDDVGRGERSKVRWVLIRRVMWFLVKLVWGRKRLAKVLELQSEREEK